MGGKFWHGPLTLPVLVALDGRARRAGWGVLLLAGPCCTTDTDRVVRKRDGRVASGHFRGYYFPTAHVSLPPAGQKETPQGSLKT